MRMSKTKVYAAVFAAVTSGSTAAVVLLAGGTSGAAEAYPVCLGVSTNGTVLGNHAVGPVCELNLPANKCATVDTGLPQAGATVYACWPN